MVVLNVPLCPKPDETGWFDLGNWTIQFSSCRQLVPTSILISASAPGTLSYPAATSSGPFSASGFASSLAKVSLHGLVCPWLLLDLSAEDPSIGPSRSCRRPGATTDFGETGLSNLVFWIVQFSCPEAVLSYWWPTYPQRLSPT
jgi:hypothetical protein